MEFNSLDAVPVAIAAFYEEQIVTEPTGNMIPENYTYHDDEGEEQLGTRQVPEYVNTPKVIQIPFDETKSWSDVNRVLSLGKPQAVIEKFVALAVNGDKQRFHGEYIAWMEECAEIDADNEDLLAQQPESEDGEEMEPVALRDYPKEPVYIATDTSIYFQKAAKKARDDGRDNPITVGGLSFDADQEAYENLKGVVASWEAMIGDQSLIDAGLVVDGKMAWTLADNSIVMVTKEALQAVVDAIRIRAGLLHAQYQADKAKLAEEVEA